MVCVIAEFGGDLQHDVAHCQNCWILFIVSNARMPHISTRPSLLTQNFILNSFINSTLNPLALYFVSSLFRTHFHNYLCCKSYPVEHNVSFCRNLSKYKSPNDVQFSKNPVTTIIDTTDFSLNWNKEKPAIAFRSVKIVDLGTNV
jgi:hypothetical protein